MTLVIANEAMVLKTEVDIFRTESVNKRARPLLRFGCFVVGASVVVQHVCAGLSGLPRQRRRCCLG